MTQKQKRLVCFALILLLVLSSATIVFAAVLFSFRADGDLPGNNDKVDGLVSLETSSQSVSFTAAGERKNIELTAKNTTNSNVVYNFGLSLVAADSSSLSNEQLSLLGSAVLVYLDGDFCGTLAAFVLGGESNICSGFLAAADGQRTHSLGLELHIAAAEELLNKDFSVRISSYVYNADYRSTIVVADETDFYRAIDDVNGGLLTGSSATTIVLSDDIALTKSVAINNAVNIDLNGYKLSVNADITLDGSGTYKLYSSQKVNHSAADGSGKIVLNSANAVLDVEDFCSANGTIVAESYSDRISVNACDMQAAVDLVAARAEKRLSSGISDVDSSVNAFGALKFYTSKIRCQTDGNFAIDDNGNVTSNLTITKNATLTVADKTDSSVFASCVFRIVGENNVLQSLFVNELKHIPNTLSGEAVTCDLFLPKYIADKNVRIEWTSSDESSISSNGKLADQLKENTVVTLYAKIFVNDGEYNSSFTFRVTSQTRETKFKYLVAQISPVKLTKVYKDELNNTDAFVYLPGVGSTKADGATSTDYTVDFDMAVDGENVTQVWRAFKDIGLVGLEYKVKSGYDFVSLNGNNAVYLNMATFYRFAQLTVTGYFDRDADGNIDKSENAEHYTENVNITIELGDNSDLFELVFAYVEKSFNQIDILQNILDTRAEYGVKYEKGDFYLESEYQSIAISYEKKSDAIDVEQETLADGTSRWIARVHPQYFSSATSSVPIVVVVGNTEQAGQHNKRTLYLQTPGIVKPDEYGFANYSVFNSAKYQVVTEVSSKEVASDGAVERIAKLPPVEVDASDVEIAVSDRTGFVLSGETVTNTTQDYILVRDLQKLQSINFSVGNTDGASNSHDKAYKFAQLLRWATGSDKIHLPFEFGTYTTSGTSAVQSDGKDYMNEAEVAVLKAFLTNQVGFNAKEVSDLFAQATQTKMHVYNGTSTPLRLIDDYTEINEKIKQILNSSSYPTDNDTYFKYTEVLHWATDEKDFDRADTSVDYKTTPNLGNVGKQNIVMNNGSIDANLIDWSSSPSSWTPTSLSNWHSSKYAKAPYQDDDTPYITDYEAQVMISFWWGYSANTGRAFAEVFMKHCVVPTYLHEDGAGIFVNAIYQKLGLQETGFTVGMADGTPETSVLDFSTAAVDYLANIKSVSVKGKTDGNTIELPAFLTTSSTEGFFNKLTKLDEERNDVKLTSLTMSACATDHVKFDLGTVSRLSAVTRIDLSGNKGITTLGDLLNVDIYNIQLLNVSGVSVDGDYLDYVLTNIQYCSPSAKIYYGTPSEPFVLPSETTVSEELRYLQELTEITSKYLLLAKQVSKDGISSKDIQWYVEQGNPGYLVSDPGSDEITDEVNSISVMNALLSDYYACSSDVSFEFDGATYNLSAKNADGKFNLYKIRYDGSKFVFDVAGEFDQIGSVPSTNTDWTDATATNINSSEQQSVSGNFNLTDYTTYSQVTTSNSTKTCTKLFESTSWWGGTTSINVGNRSVSAYGLYEVKETFSQTITYRWVQDNGCLTLSKVYFNGQSLEQARFESYSSSAKYVDYTVKETRTFVRYYYKTSSNTNTNTVVTFVDGTVTYSGGTYTSSTTATTIAFEANYVNNPLTTSFSGNDAKTRLENNIKNLSATSSRWSSLASTQNVVITTLFSYVKHISNGADGIRGQDYLAVAEAARSGFLVYKYTGATGNETYFVDGSQVNSSYTRNQGYRLRFGTTVTSSGFRFEEYDIHATTEVFTMEGILAEANKHLNDVEFGNFYGNYYCYNGNTAIVNDRTYAKDHIYRLLIDKTTGRFEFVDTGKTLTTLSDLRGALNSATLGESGALQEGAIVYYTQNDNYYGRGLFELTLNKETGAYYFKSMGGLGNVQFTESAGFTTSQSDLKGQNLSADGISKFTNIRYVGSTSQQYYSGTGGSEEVIVVARIVDNGVVYERKFKVTVSA